jgi:hypothetical protein
MRLAVGTLAALAGSAVLVSLPASGQDRTEPLAGQLEDWKSADVEITSGELYGMDHGIDWLDDDEQAEERARSRSRSCCAGPRRRS